MDNYKAKRQHKEEVERERRRAAGERFFGFELVGGVDSYDDNAPLDERIARTRSMYGPVEQLKNGGDEAGYVFLNDPTDFRYPSRAHAEQARDVAVKIGVLLYYNCSVEGSIDDVVRVALEALQRTIDPE